MDGAILIPSTAQKGKFKVGPAARLRTKFHEADCQSAIQPIGNREPGVLDLKKVEPGSEATRFLFEKSLNRRAQAEGRDTIRLKVGLSQRDQNGGADRKAMLVREIRHRPNSFPVWHSYADRFDGSARIEDPHHLEKLRDALLPRHLARFFFFDAERGLNFSFGQQEIVEGVTRILGLWSYAELEAALRHLIYQRIPRSFNASLAHEAARKLADLAGRIVTVNGQLIALREECSRVSVEINESKSELTQVEEQLHSLPTANTAALESTEETRAKASEAKLRLETELSAAWAVSIPIALLGPSRRKLHEDLLAEEKRRDWEKSTAAITTKIPQVQNDFFADVPPEYSLSDQASAFYKQRLEQVLHQFVQPPPLGMAHHIFLTDQTERSARIRMQLARTANPLRRLVDLSAQAESIASKLSESDSPLSQLPHDPSAPSVSAELYQKRGELAARADHLEKQHANLLLQIRSLEEDLTQLKREETDQTALALKARHGQSLITLASRYREAAAEIRRRAAQELRQEISDQVGRLWLQITDRQREFLGMEFGPDWDCSLLRRDGAKVTWEDTNTSAGQRQVRTLAFFEALRRLARLVPPLVVDTPLGRLDKEVKDSVLDQLYLTGHQTIILTTNSEIDPEGPLFERIKPKLARVYTLHAHGEETSPTYEVRVSNDYFGKLL